ncbi:sensor domain-containing diguanylate cyclase [Longispora albida]|uniref:sensor domain-containing diguanylate cyclase n=1 Tax=Longispora albida TaxID=203523 RepID=UPI0003611710|nr:diguanylate cyclase [Longispora albida]
MPGLHHAVLEAGDAAVLVVDPGDLGVRWASPAAGRLLGLPGGVSGRFPELVVAADAARVATLLMAVAGRGEVSRCTCAVPVGGSADRRVDLVIRDLSADPEIGGLVVTASDVTAWAELADRLGDRLNTDPLTGLANRMGFLPRLEQAIHSAHESGPGPVLMFLDLDQFKYVNNHHGHVAGDEVLRQIAARIAGAVDGRGTAARFGGDEFLVLLDRSDAEEARAAADEILSAVSVPLRLPGEPGEEFSPAMSAGVALVRPRRLPQELLREADLAMYRAKALGRSRTVVYDPGLEDWEEARHQQADRLAAQVEQLQSENRRLARAALTDQRTGLPNSAAFDADHARAHDAGEPYSLLLIDLDLFHSYNAHYLYLAGHETLRKVGQAIRQAVPAARTYRYGGEEFAVLLPGTRLPGAMAAGEQVRLAVEALGIEHCGNPSGVVTVCVGVVEASQPSTVTDAVEQASIAVLEAKDTGRNRTVGAKVPVRS